ncbi:MAG: methylmalonyl-CoA epimerase [Calditrichaeota bacterium]|nr:methylmalonyl-CoA epimerase [Calditrichota bacterium]
MLKKVDHIGIAVTSIEPVKQFYREVFGLEPVFEEEVSEQKVRVVGFQVGETRLEYLEPTAEDSPIARFLHKRGEGMHHIALSVTHIQHALEVLKSHGIQLIDEKPRIGAEGKKIAFVHPKSTHGVLIELSEE